MHRLHARKKCLPCSDVAIERVPSLFSLTLMQYLQDARDIEQSGQTAQMGITQEKYSLSIIAYQTKYPSSFHRARFEYRANILPVGSDILSGRS